MFILIYLLNVLTALDQARSLGYDQKPRYTPTPTSNRLWHPNYNQQQQQGDRNMNYMQRDDTKQKAMRDAETLMQSKMNVQRMKERDLLMRRRDAANREGTMPAWPVPRAKHISYTEALASTHTGARAWTMKWSKYMDMPPYRGARPTSARTAVNVSGTTRGRRDIEAALGSRARVTTDNPGLKLQVNSARRSYKQDLTQFGKSEIPTEELRKTLKKIDEQLAKYENGIYKLFKPNYYHDSPKLEAIKKQDLPIDDKVHTLLKTLKTKRNDSPLAAVGDISDISI